MMTMEAIRDEGLDRLRSPMSDHLAISLGHYSTAGRKPENQDFHGSVTPKGGTLASQGIALCLADGISTSRLGATAAETAVKSFLTDYYCTPDSWSARNAGERVIAATNSWMHAQNARHRPREEGKDREAEALICTFSAIVLKSRVAHIFHVGDARIARISNGGFEPLNELHRIALGGGQTYLGRALGVNRTVEIDYSAIGLQTGDLLLMMTDGVHEHVSPAETVATIRNSITLDDAASALADLALERGSNDNLTVQIARIESLPAGRIDDLIGQELSLKPTPELKAGDAFDGYEIIRQIHGGSRSHVFLARDVADGTRVALKVPSTEHAQDEAEISALMLEDWVMRRISHQNVLGAPPQKRARRYLYSVSRYVEGQTLDEWMADNPEPELPAVRDIVRQIAAGLLALHRRQMTHRDLRPKNILIDRDGTVKIIDFGSVEVAGVEEIAPSENEDAAFAGTMQYSAPEVYLGEPASARSDLFSLGVIAYQMLTGEFPYGPRVAAARTPAAQRRLRYTPSSARNAAVPDWMDAALARAVSIDPDKRYDELSEFIFDLSHPNRALARPEPVPLIKRGSADLWRAIALLLGLALAISLLTRPDLGLPSTNHGQETKQ
ncbi:MAG: protein kinase [Sphingobium sp.]